MFDFVQGQQANDHGAKRQYAHRYYSEHKDFIAVPMVSSCIPNDIQMEMTRRLLAVSIKSKVTGDKVLNNTGNGKEL